MLVSFVLGCAGCSPPKRFSSAQADRDVARLLATRRHRAADIDDPLDIVLASATATRLRASLGAAAGATPAASEFAPRSLRVRDSVELARDASREMLFRREAVYLAALAVVGERSRLERQGTLGGTADVSFDSSGAVVSATPEATLGRTSASGAGIVLRLAGSLLRNIGGDPLRTARSVLGLELLVPLLRGSGPLVVLEPLRQSEQDLIASLREFARFRQTLVLDVASQHWRALQSAETARNEGIAYESLRQLVEEQTENAISGRIPPFQVDQARQNLLAADDRRQGAEAEHEADRDRLALDLGLPPTAPIGFDLSELEVLRASGLQPVPFAREESLARALAYRLDLANARAAECDARRHVAVARDALRTQADLRLGLGADSDEDSPLDFGDGRPSGVVGLDLDLPLERTAERNEVRSREVVLLRTIRDREALEDSIAFEVRQAWRDLDRAARSHVLQLESVRLAERRVESTADLMAQGAATIRDRLEAESALVDSRNAVVRVLIDHAIARGRLLVAVGSTLGLFGPESAEPEVADPASSSSGEPQ